MTAWSCPHDLDGVCQRINGARCEPGMRGCVLEGKVRMENGRAIHEYLTDDQDEDSLFAPARNALSGPADIESLARFTP